MEEKTAFLYIMSSEKTEMEKLPLIQNQMHSRVIFKEPPQLWYKKQKSLKDSLVRAKL